VDDIDGVFPKDAEINLYRIVQEGLNNIFKHSGASRASLLVRRDDRSVSLTIGDNGKGFSPSATPGATGKGGFGLIGISERALLLGGAATIESTPNEGTAIQIVIPC